MAADTVLTPAEARFLTAARTAVLATIAPTGQPRLVPICFVLDESTEPPRIYSPIDEKPKRVTDPHDLKRIRDIAANPRVTVLVDHWSEDWSALAWIRVQGRADLIEPAAADVGADHGNAVAALRAKYPQYATHHLETRPMIRIVVDRARSWGSLGEA